MSGLSRFLKKNKIQKQNAKYVATRSLVDEDGKPLEWELRPISTRESEKIRVDCSIEVQITGKPGQYRQKLDSGKYISRMLAAAVVYPDLQNAELQDSYGVTNPEDLLYEMIDSPGEYNEMATFVQQYSGLDETMEEKVQEAKN